MRPLQTKQIKIMKQQSPTIGLISLGCAKALVDSEGIMSRLVSEGYQFVDDYQDADLIIINTCGFINEAIEESLEAIGDALQNNSKVIVTGCLGAREQTILDRYPEVLAIIGPDKPDELYQAIHKALPPPHQATHEENIKLTPSHYAYIKISEGCNHSCSYCIIPELRGKLKSRALIDIQEEATRLVKAGTKELIIVSQDTAAYGQDLNYKNGLMDLANMLAEFDCWIRFHYLYPYPVIDELLPLMKTHKILPYLDVPLQHSNPRILSLMKRPAHRENMLERIQKWRDICPEITIRSTFMVGFPGETNEEFEDLLSFLETAKLDRVGCFKYSPVEGAKANELPNQISEDIKEERLEILMNLQTDISREKLANKIGQKFKALVDEVNEDSVIARTMGDSPEVDGNVIIETDKQLSPGDFVEVTITKSDEHDLWGNANCRDKS